MSRTTSLSRRVLETDCMLQGLRMVRLLEVRADRRYREEGFVDITAARVLVLSVLFNARRPVTAQGVADQLAISKVSASRLVNALEKGDWVVRKEHPGDGRAYQLTLSAKARRNFHRFVQLHNEQLDILFQGLSGDQLKQLQPLIRTRIEKLATEA